MKYIFLFTSAIGATVFMLCILSNNFKNIKKYKRISLIKIVNRKISIFLEQTKVNISPIQYIISYFVIFALSFVAINALTKTPLLSVVIAIGICFIPYSIMLKQQLKISKELMSSWPEALREINASIAAGYSLSYSINSLSKVGPQPIKEYLDRFSILERSMGFNAALQAIKSEMNDATSDKIIEILIVANDRGGKIIKEIINELITSIEQDIALSETIATENIEMKINSRAVVVIPWCVLLLLTLSGGVFRQYYSSRSGAFVIVIGIIMSISGIIILNKLSKVQPPKRVFARELSR